MRRITEPTTRVVVRWTPTEPTTRVVGLWNVERSPSLLLGPAMLSDEIPSRARQNEASSVRPPLQTLQTPLTLQTRPDPHVRELTLRSLKAMINQMREKIAVFESRSTVRSVE